MLLTILSLLADAVCCWIPTRNLYTDRAMLPDGEMHEWRRSPLHRLEATGQAQLMHLQWALAAISAVTGILLLLGVKSRAVYAIQRIATVASTAVFVIILLVAGGVRERYG